MARVKATISQPAIRARRFINQILASVGSGLPIRAKFDRLVRLRAEFGVGFTIYVSNNLLLENEGYLLLENNNKIRME